MSNLKNTSRSPDLTWKVDETNNFRADCHFDFNLWNKCHLRYFFYLNLPKFQHLKSRALKMTAVSIPFHLKKSLFKIKAGPIEISNYIWQKQNPFHTPEKLSVCWDFPSCTWPSSPSSKLLLLPSVFSFLPFNLTILGGLHLSCSH